MAVSLLARELVHYDPLFWGVTPLGVVGSALVCGLGWCDPAGVYVLYSGVDAVGNIDYDVPVGATSPTSATPTTIANFPTYTLAADTVYYFALRAIGLGGAEEENTISVQRIETGFGGEPLPAIPNAPYQLSAHPRAGGKIYLRWEYEQTGQQTAPAAYLVYHDNGTGTVSYEATLGETAMNEYLTGAYAHGTTVKFVVRATSSIGDYEANTTEVSAVADDTGPDDAAAPTVVAGAET